MQFNQEKLNQAIIKIISETNGLTLADTLELLYHSHIKEEIPSLEKELNSFHILLNKFGQDKASMHELIVHPVGIAFFNFFKKFPVKYNEEHIHLTGSLTPEFIYQKLAPLLEGPLRSTYKKKIIEVYGKDSWPINSIEDVYNLVTLKEGEQFDTYLRILYLAKIILRTKLDHVDAAYHMAYTLYHEYNIGKVRLKFTLSRVTQKSSEQIPGIQNLTEEDVLLGLYDGFKSFQKEYPDFDFVLSPSFRKENDFFDAENFDTKKEHFNYQVDRVFEILEKYPFLKERVLEVDTVGDEKELYRKAHFEQMKEGLRRLQYRGFRIRSHHGETWKTLKRGVQSVDNAMNIWFIDTLEHGLSLGINPNFYYHHFFERVYHLNLEGKAVPEKTPEFEEINDMYFKDPIVKEKLLAGTILTDEEARSFLKTKFHHAREVEHYQHDVLNRMINKNVSLVALPSSNLKLTGCFPDYKDHPFSWWEKKGVDLGVGTDNYITLNTNFIKELIILLFSDYNNLKITKLLMVATKEQRRPYISHLLWQMRKKENR